MKLLFVFVFICVAIACTNANLADFLLKNTVFRKKTTPLPTNYCEQVKRMNLHPMNGGNSIIPNYNLMVRHWEQQCQRQRANLPTHNGAVSFESKMDPKVPKV